MENYYTPVNTNQQENFESQVYYKNMARLERKEIRRTGNMMGLAILLNLFGQIMVSTVIYSNKAFLNAYNNSPVFQGCVSILGIELLSIVVPFGIIALINRKKYAGALIPSDYIKPSKCFLWVGFGMIACIAANYVVSIVMNVFSHFGYKLTQGESLQPDSPFACLITIVSVAVVPAICEEFAMRCCSLGLLRRHGKAFGVAAVAIIFGLIHGNVIQFVFACLIGFILGYVTVKTNSIIPAILIHGFNNAMSAFTSVIVYYTGKKNETTATLVMFLFWVVMGAVCTFVLSLKKDFRSGEAEPKPPYGNSLAAKLGAFLTSPVLIASAAYLVYATIKSIEKI